MLAASGAVCREFSFLDEIDEERDRAEQVARIPLTGSRRGGAGRMRRKIEEFLFDLLGWSRSDKFLSPTRRREVACLLEIHRMTITEAMRALVGNPKLMATLPPGPPGAPAVVATSGNRLMDVRNGKPRTYTGKFRTIARYNGRSSI